MTIDATHAIARRGTIIGAALLAAAFSASPAASGAASAAVTVTPNAPPTAAERAAAQRALAADFHAVATAAHRRMTITVGHADLNGDGRADLIIVETDAYFCGSHGCSAYALLATPHGYSTHAIALAIFAATITVLPGSHHFMHDLRFDDATHVFRWTGRAYR
jgi:hypothetical protein